MEDYTFDHLGIWSVRKREKSGLEELGFYNCYAGIDQLKCLVVRLDNFEKETVELGVSKMSKLLKSDKDKFANKLQKINTQVKTAKKVYSGIESKEGYDIRYFKNLSKLDIDKLEKRINCSQDNKKILQIVAIKEAIEDIIKHPYKSLDKAIDTENEKNLKPCRECKDYSITEDKFIIDNFTKLSARQIAAHLGRTKNAITSRMRRLREDGRL